jgi:XTP/dITP diphosphohydrolase
MNEICFATNNKHKLEEVAEAVGKRFKILSLEELSVFEELPETQDTLEGNALQKALHVFNKTLIPCFADDTGLEVGALNGAPGVYSARYAGPQRNSDDNVRKLLDALTTAAGENRKARFRTVIALVGFGEHMLFEGVVNGVITEYKRGNAGFGYDPVFMPEGFQRTFAEMSMEEKNNLSHRGQAVEKLVRYLGLLSS